MIAICRSEMAKEQGVCNLHTCAQSLQPPHDQALLKLQRDGVRRRGVEAGEHRGQAERGAEVWQALHLHQGPAASPIPKPKVITRDNPRVIGICNTQSVIHFQELWAGQCWCGPGRQELIHQHGVRDARAGDFLTPKLRKKSDHED